MKKISFATIMVWLTMSPSFHSTSIVFNSPSQDQKTNANYYLAFEQKKYNAVENWYKPFGHNQWKVFITSYTWEHKFLAWVGDALIGKYNTPVLKTKFAEEFKSWPRGGNRNFSNDEYYELANYTYNYMIEISNFFFKNKDINRIVFTTKSDNSWEGLSDASVYKR